MIQKIYNKLETEVERADLRDLVQANLQYVSDKSTRAKCLALIKDVPIVITTSPQKQQQQRKTSHGVDEDDEFEVTCLKPQKSASPNGSEGKAGDGKKSSNSG